ncbi:hypothetical protein SFRURICE_018190 [Spodoptera frugiperda]|nr:hypothetical protein SFRURICE_018190 [Spodoptera frugiperda]
MSEPPQLRLADEAGQQAEVAVVSESRLRRLARVGPPEPRSAGAVTETMLACMLFACLHAACLLACCLLACMHAACLFACLHAACLLNMAISINENINCTVGAVARQLAAVHRVAGLIPATTRCVIHRLLFVKCLGVVCM